MKVGIVLSRGIPVGYGDSTWCRKDKLGGHPPSLQAVPWRHHHRCRLHLLAGWTHHRRRCLGAGGLCKSSWHADPPLVRTSSRRLHVKSFGMRTRAV